MPARYDTIIVVRKRNARGDEVEYHTVGRRGPSIWRTGEPNPPGTPGYQAAYDAAIGVQAVLAPPATGHGWHTVNDLLDAYERSREFCRLAAHPGRLPDRFWIVSGCGEVVGALVGHEGPDDAGRW